MSYLLKCLVICSKNPQLLSHIHICPKPKVKLGPTDLIYPAPPSSFDIATARNPNILVTPIRISVSPMACCNCFGLTKIVIGHTELA